jgi:hypothetical protein
MSAIFDQIIDLLFGDVTNILLLIVALVVAFALTERWRIEWNAKRKRERQNRSRPEDV